MYHRARSHPIHLAPVELHNHSVIIFVTVCTHERRKCLANPEAHRLLRSIWGESSFWLVGRYVLMPDHLHFFCAPGEKDYPMEKWMGYWKRRASLQWETRLTEPMFQRDFFDRQLRSSESYDAKWEYVRMNPVRAGLVERPEDWPYQGEMNLVSW